MITLKNYIVEFKHPETQTFHHGDFSEFVTAKSKEDAVKVAEELFYERHPRLRNLDTKCKVDGRFTYKIQNQVEMNDFIDDSLDLTQAEIEYLDRLEF